MVPSPIWPLAEHASLGQNCFDASIGSVWFFISYSMPVDTCFFKSSFPFHRLVGLYLSFWRERVYGPASIALFSRGGTPRTYDESAEELFIAQPSLSQTIGRLEKE